eukprot:476078-Hanusia_phi.AAC.2
MLRVRGYQREEWWQETVGSGQTGTHTILCSSSCTRTASSCSKRARRILELRAMRMGLRTMARASRRL